MKALFAVIALTLFTTATQAAPVHARVKLEGTVKFEMSYTMTCMAIGCPPSVPYFFVVLQDARSEDGKYSFAALRIEQLTTNNGSTQKPAFIAFNGQKLRENEVVVMDLDINTYASAKITLAGKVYSVEKK